MYQSDITYGTNNEFGFDYLRDNMVYAASERVQKPLSLYEVDSILIDESRTPLVISGAISLATIYNTIDAFKKSGHIKEVLTNNNTSY